MNKEMQRRAKADKDKVTKIEPTHEKMLPDNLEAANSYQNLAGVREKES